MQLEFDFDYPEEDKKRAIAKARLPVFTPLYYKIFNLVGRCYRFQQDYNCHTFIQRYNLKSKMYEGGWIDYEGK